MINTTQAATIGAQPRGPKGSVGVSWRGAWLPGGAYLAGDVVASGGKLWVAVRAGQFTPGDLSTAAWQVLVDVPDMIRLALGQLPTTQPSEPGVWWNNAGAVSISMP